MRGSMRDRIATDDNLLYQLKQSKRLRNTATDLTKRCQGPRRRKYVNFLRECS